MLQASLLRLGLQAVGFDAEQEAHDRALLRAFTKGKRQSYQPIGQVTADRISQIDDDARSALA